MAAKGALVMIAAVAFMAISAGLIPAAHASRAEEKLMHDLFANYEPKIRPVVKTSDSVVVDLWFTPITINAVDVDEGEMMLHGWLKLVWTDVRLRWNTSDHDNITVLNVPVETLWQPDLKLYNGPSFELDNTLALIYSSGQVMWVPPMSSQVSCNLSATWFPFDEQKCTLKFGSWTYDKNKINLKVGSSTDDEPPARSPEWRVLSMETVRKEKKYDCCPEPYPSIETTLTMRRKACPYIVQGVLPMVTLAALGLLTMMIPATRADVRLIVLALLLGSAMVQIQLSDFGAPRKLSALSILNGELLTVLVGLFVCNCVHMAILRGHMDCSLLTKLSGLVGSAGAATNGEKSEALLSDAIEQRYHRTLDSVFTLPLAFIALLSIGLFLAIPLF